MKARRGVGLALLVLCLPPLHRLLDPARTGLAGETTRRLAEVAWSTGLLGSVVVVGAALALARVMPLEGLPPMVGRALERAAALPAGVWATLVGATATGASSAVAFGLFAARPTSVDEMVQLLHAQALAAGRLGWTVPGPEAAWAVANGVVVDGRWSAIAPPGQTALLAGGLLADAAWLVGPVCTGLAAAFTALGLRRLWPDDPAPAHAGGLLMALSPFVVLLGGTHLSHTGAAAFTAMVFWSALRARDGAAGWAVLTGAAAGALLLTRPWTGLVLGLTLPAVIWGPGPGLRVRRRGTRWLLRRVGAATAGGLPPALLLLAWNQALYGHPLRLGYSVAFGEAHGLGFHPDPWGNLYGPLEALAYTASDLTTLGMHLLESPLSPVLLVGAALLAARQWPRDTGVLLAWVGATLGANLLYWHHGQHLGPRFLYESAPAWAGLTAGAFVALHRGLRRGLHRDGRGGAWVRWAGVLALAGALLALPGRVRSIGGAYQATATVPPPPTPAAQRPSSGPVGGPSTLRPSQAPSLVLVHGSWSGRVAARLVQAGVRRDSVETALRRNGLCRVQRYADARLAGSPLPEPPLDWTLRPGAPPGLRTVELSPGNRVRLEPGPLAPTCAAQAGSDTRAGTLELVTLLWQAPPDPDHATLLARDLGPEANRATLEAHPGRTPWLAVPNGAGGVRLLPYAEGVDRVWRGGAEGPAGPTPGTAPGGGDPGPRP